MKLRTVVLSLVLFVCAAAAAWPQVAKGSWIFLGVSQANSIAYYVSPKVDVDKSTKQVFGLTRNVGTVGDSQGYYAELTWEADCTGRRAKPTYYKLYSPDDELLESRPYKDSEFMAFPSKSYGTAMLDIWCTEPKPSPTPSTDKITGRILAPVM